MALSPPRTLSLEDVVFGLDSRAAAAAAGGAPPPSPRAAADPVTHVMLPVVATCLLVGISLWSISRSVRYHEIFVMKPRYQYGLYAMNAAAVFVTVVVLCRQHRVK